MFLFTTVRYADGVCLENALSDYVRLYFGLNICERGLSSILCLDPKKLDSQPESDLSYCESICRRRKKEGSADDVDKQTMSVNP
jgi:hypothetical protein